MKFKSVIFLAAIGVVLCACAHKTADIKTDGSYDQAYDFKKLKTYQWKTPSRTLHNPNGNWSPSNVDAAAELTFLIEDELRSRGLSQVKENPDSFLVVTVNIDMENQEAVSDYKEGIEALYTLPKGALVVSLVEASSNKVLWVGSAEAVVQNNKEPDMVKTRLKAAVSGIFDSCPF